MSVVFGGRIGGWCKFCIVYSLSLLSRLLSKKEVLHEQWNISELIQVIIGGGGGGGFIGGAAAAAPSGGAATAAEAAPAKEEEKKEEKEESDDDMGFSLFD